MTPKSGAQGKAEQAAPESVGFAPLAGIRVLDLSRVLAGPLCTQMLADLGADIVKIEPCEGGDETRGWPPFVGGDGAIFLAVNRGKRSVAVDLKTEAGREIVLRLARDADVLVENFRTGVVQRLGIDYAAIKRVNPRVIYASISGYGRSGPLATLPGYDAMAQAYCGVMSLTGEPDSPPVRSAPSPLDQTTGIVAAFGIVTALHERDRTGQGRLLEVSLYDTALTLLGYSAQTYWATGKMPQRSGSGHGSLCPYQAFEAADGRVMIGVANDGLWRRFCAAAGLEGIRDDPRFHNNAARVTHFAETVGIVAARVKTKTVAQWIEILNAASVPVAPINSLDQVLAHEQTAASGMLLSYEHPAYGSLQGMGLPIRFDGGARKAGAPPPLLGEHTVEVLRSLGYDDTSIETWRKQGVLRALPPDQVNAAPGQSPAARAALQAPR